MVLARAPPEIVSSSFLVRSLPSFRERAGALWARDGTINLFSDCIGFGFGGRTRGVLFQMCAFGKLSERWASNIHACFAVFGINEWRHFDSRMSIACMSYFHGFLFVSDETNRLLCHSDKYRSRKLQPCIFCVAAPWSQGILFTYLPIGLDLYPDQFLHRSPEVWTVE